MKPDRILRIAFLCLMLFVLRASAGNSQGSQTGGSRDSGLSGSNNAPYGTSTRTQPGASAQRLRYLYIFGNVVTDNGLPADPGTVIERICNGVQKKEAHVSASGQFGFQVGADNGTMPDASDSLPQGLGNTGFGNTRQFPGLLSYGAQSSASLIGCELRAQLAGYRSSSVILDQFQTSGQIDVGTIVLHPIAQVPGTRVSATDLQAPKEARKAFSRSVKAMEKKKVEEAEKNLRTAVGFYPNYASAWHKLGIIHLQQQLLNEAHSDFTKAIDLDPKFVNPYIELAHIAVIQEKWQEAADITDRALELDPLDFPGGFFLNACAKFRLNKLDEAERSARKALRLDGAHVYPHAHLVLGNVLMKKKDFAGAVEQFSSFLKVAPMADGAGQIRSLIQKLEGTTSSAQK